MTHVTNAAIDLTEYGLADVIPDYTGWLVDDDEAAVIHQALTLFLLTIPDHTDFRNRLCAINRELKNHFNQEGGAK